MKIAIDGYEANAPQRLGSSQIGFNLLRVLYRLDKENEYTIFLPEKPRDDLPPACAKWQYKILRPKRLWTRIALPIALFSAKQKYDLIFSPTHYIPRFSPIKRIATIFDLAFIHFPEMFEKKDLWQLKNWTKFSAENAEHILTISNFSKQDILKQYHVAKDNVTVAYPGYDTKLFYPRNVSDRVEQVIKRYKIDKSYIIYIGTLQPRKNLVRLIEAVSRIEDVKLVIVGKTSGPGRGGWMYQEILDAPKLFKAEDRVIFTGFVPNDDLPYLLSQSLAFVLPSLYEGFGMPLLDAMACGVPVICSNVSSLPEVVGRAGLLVNPYSVDQIEQAIRTVISDKKLRARKIKDGLAQVEKFSWEKMAKIAIKIFEEIA